MENQQSAESQLWAILDAYHPAPVRLFSSMDRQIALEFVQDYPTPAIASRVCTARMQGFLTPAQLQRPGSSPDAVEQYARQPAHRSQEHRGRQVILGADLREAARAAHQQLANYDDAIACTLAERPDAPIFASFPGVGPVLSAVLLAEIGEDRDRFPTPEVLLSEAGLAPVVTRVGALS